MAGADLDSRSLDASVISLDETDGSRLPDIKDVAEIARAQFADMLTSEEGKKDLVIQSELMTLLEHVTPMGFLRKYVTLSLPLPLFPSLSCGFSDHKLKLNNCIYRVNCNINLAAICTIHHILYDVASSAREWVLYT